MNFLDTNLRFVEIKFFELFGVRRKQGNAVRTDVVTIGEVQDLEIREIFGDIGDRGRGDANATMEIQVDDLVAALKTKQLWDVICMEKMNDRQY